MTKHRALVIEATLDQQKLDAALDTVLNAVRDRPDEVAAAIDKLAAKLGAERANSVLDEIEVWLSAENGIRCRLPQPIRDAARPVGQCGHA